MPFRMWVSAVCVILCSLMSAECRAQSSSSSGVTVALSKVIVAQQRIILQFMITNNTKARVYLMDARADPSQKAFLGSGGQLPNYPEIASLTSCNLSANECIVNPNMSGDLNKYSYVEAGDSVGMSMQYYASQPVNESDSISLSVALVARFSAVGTDPQQAGKPIPLRFNFPSMHLNHH